MVVHILMRGSGPDFSARQREADVGMRRLVQLLVLVTPLILAASAQSQQPAGGRGGRGAPPEPPKNLQILPRDIPRPELIATMGGFARGLGVQCSYCHVQAEPDGRDDMAADDKAPKKTARIMMKIRSRTTRKCSRSIRRTRPRSDSSIS